ncbi:MAG TPA: tail fiber domain-containing protein, partial [Thermoanaerobaculia bacterium]
EGNVTHKEAAIFAQGGRVSIEQRADSDALTVLGTDENGPKITLLAHDGTHGSVVSTNGDLTFRFGNFLAGKDVERMRLTAEGDLHVDGLIRASKGIMFSDGTIVTTAAGVAAAETTGNATRQRVNVPGAVNNLDGLRSRSSGASSRLTPRPAFAPAYQFVVGDTGVNIGTTNPAYNLDVTGYINTATQYNIGGSAFAHNFGNSNTFVGVFAGNFTLSGSFNTAEGVFALNGNTSGGNNTAVGYAALGANTGGSFNTAVGKNALNANTTGINNTASGASALASVTTGGSNTAVGASALISNSTGCCNTAVGTTVLLSATGQYNTALGSGALATVTTGNNNVAIGSFAGSNITNGDYNVDIVNAGLAADANTMRIGSGNQARTFISAIRGITTGAGDAIPVLVDSNGQLGTASSSRRYKFDVAEMGTGTDGLMRLRPVTFRYLAHGDNAPLQYGLIAEEVAEVYPELVAHDKDGQAETVMYQFLAPMLLNEVQKQHRKIEEQQKTIDALRMTLDALGQRLEALEKRAGVAN